MGGELRSGTSWAELRQSMSFSGCEWRVAEPEQLTPPDSSSPIEPRVKTVSTSSSCRHLGESGGVRLEFINDGLMSLEFIPEDFAAYETVLRGELVEIGAVREKVQPEEFVLEDGTRILFAEKHSIVDHVSVRVIRRGDVTVISWVDLDLAMWAISL